MAQKREANAFVDVITAEDIGKFPDKNVADALQRVPGVIIIARRRRRQPGQHPRPAVRPDADRCSTATSSPAADSGDPQRSFNYVLLPSNFIASTEVYKSPEARLEEGGVGGTIILNTRAAARSPAWSGFASAEGTYSDTTEKFDPQLAGQLSWKNEAETFGVLVGGVWQKRSNRELRGTTETWRWWSDRDDDGNVLTPATDVNGNPFANDDAISYWPRPRRHRPAIGTALFGLLGAAVGERRSVQPGARAVRHPGDGADQAVRKRHRHRPTISASSIAAISPATC